MTENMSPANDEMTVSTNARENKQEPTIHREPMKIEVLGYEAITKTVRPASEKISRVYLPKTWAGKKVKIILLDELEDDN